VPGTGPRCCTCPEPPPPPLPAEVICGGALRDPRCP
jgi:hypothetical protein